MKKKSKINLPQIPFKPEPGWIIVLPIFSGASNVIKSKGIFIDTITIKRDNLERGTVVAANGIERGKGVIYLKYGYEKIIEGGHEFVLLNEERLIGVYEKSIKEEDFI